MVIHSFLLFIKSSTTNVNRDLWGFQIDFLSTHQRINSLAEPEKRPQMLLPPDKNDFEKSQNGVIVAGFPKT
jgi:hypothetical protein